MGISIELCLKSNQLQSIRTKEYVQCDIKFQLTENKLKPIENIQFKIKLYREKKNGTFSYTIEYPYPPTNSEWFPHNVRLSQFYCALFSSVFCVLDLTAWDHLGVGMKTLMGIKKRRISRWFRIRLKKFYKMHKKIFLAKMWRKYALFTFPHFRQTCFDFNVFWCI